MSKINKTHYFMTLQELAHKATTEPCNSELRESDLASHYAHPIAGTNNLQDAFEVVRDGWKNGKAIIDDMTTRYNEVFSKWFPKQDFTNLFVKSFSGGTVDIDAAIKGEPENMLEIMVDSFKVSASGGQRGKLQRLIVNCDCCGYVSENTILSRGGIIASLVNTLELAGFDTEVIVAFKCVSSNSEIELTYFCTVKPFGAMLNLFDLAFALAHPAMLRRFVFSLNEQEPELEVAKDLILRGYGRSVDLTEEQILKYGSDTGVDLGYGNLHFPIITANHSLEDMLSRCAKIVEKHFTTIKLGCSDNSTTPTEPEIDNPFKELPPPSTSTGNN